jgi:GT2 family glycosyltransferase
VNQQAPIALFVYNRPEHTRRTLEALQRNRGAKSTHLFIFADGLQTGAGEQEQKQLVEVRQLVREKPWCGSVDIIESDENQGLKQSICSGIDHVLESFDRVIVLEDDLETSPGFLEYMNDALTMYVDHESVFQVSGFMVRNRARSPATGFLRVSTSWGWGTWRRAWHCYRDDAEHLLAEVAQKGRAEFDLDGCSFHFEELERNVKGELNTWAVRWYASVFLNNGLCLYPRQTLVRNHGFDGTGVHCHDDSSDYHPSLKLAERIAVSEQPITENVQYMKSMQAHYKYMLQLWTGTRFRDRAIRKVRHALRLGK